MEEGWQKFAATGRIKDYLSYCTAKYEETDNREQMKRTGEENGTDDNSAWNGYSIDSNGRI